jgi:hypothetical protein
MGVPKRSSVEVKLLRLALRAAREALQTFPAEQVKCLPRGQAKADLQLWTDVSRNRAICELTTIIGDVPVERIDPRSPPDFVPTGNPAAINERMEQLKKQLGIPSLRK